MDESAAGQDTRSQLEVAVTVDSGQHPPTADAPAPETRRDAAAEPPQVQATIRALGLAPNIEGGYFAVTDLSSVLIPSPYPPTALSEATLALAGETRPSLDPAFRRLSSSIFYYLTPRCPVGSFHRNRSRIVHSWHRGRGRYVLIHPGGRLESFIVGPDVLGGERLQWVVEGGVWKASHLLEPSPIRPDDGGSAPGKELLITETVVPGFEYSDHEFLSREQFAKLLSEGSAQELQWLVRP
ncbi:hypothetical protein CDD83_8540 [Cordyceps sp. RAO-2017]|nr:hypothetical protein CDD83_8540 [Cordyceps sp. RAO-2017]